MQIKLKEMPNQLLIHYLANQNAWMWSKPGVGKTEITGVFEKKMQERIPEFRAHPVYVPTMGPTDIQAGMPNLETHMIEMFNNGTLPNRYKDVNAKGVVFFDELGNGDPTVLKLLQKYVRGEDMNGILQKPQGIMIIAASNRLQDKAGSIQQFRAFLNSFTHFDVYTEAEDCQEYAEKHAWNATVQAFFREFPQCIDNYEEVFEGKRGSTEEVALATEEGKRGVWANMRGWKIVGELENAAEQLKTDLAPQAITGRIGSGVGAQYIAFRSMVGRLKTADEICADPEKATIPKKIDELYAQCIVLALRCTEKQLPKVHTYGARLQYDMQALILRRLMKRPNFALVGSSTYVKWIADKQLADLLVGK